MAIKDQLLLKLLSTVNLNATQSAEATAKQMRVKSHRIQYGRRVLSERYGLISIPFINYGRLGIVSYLILFSLRSDKHRPQILKAISKHPRVGWLGELAGTFELGCALLVTDVVQVRDFLQSICDTYGDVFSSRQIIPRVTFEWFGRRYLSQNMPQRGSLRYTARDSQIAVDPLDIKILTTLANSRAAAIQSIAMELGMPYPTIIRRVRRLEDNGVIEGYFASIDTEHLNREAYRTLIQTGTSSKDAAAKIRKIAEEDPRATYFVEAIGPWEFEIGWELESARELSAITATISAALSNRLVQVQVLNELSDLKWSFFPSEGVISRE
jgi:DNA-binding Lrp family transcriptional regulator